MNMHNPSDPRCLLDRDGNFPQTLSCKAGLGFSFEGVFRQTSVYKQRSRDTAWFSITDNGRSANKLS
ncbi:hypothetical protein PPNK14_14550 [Pectobacterium parmentieri]